MKKNTESVYAAEHVLLEKKGNTGNRLHQIIIKKDGERIAHITYEIVGSEIKIWNRNVRGNPEERKKLNIAFAANKANPEKHSLGEELVFLETRKHNPIGLTTPARTASSINSWRRIEEKFGIRLGIQLPDKIPSPAIKLSQRRRI